MPWRAGSLDRTETGHALLALLRLGDDVLLAELVRRGIEPAAVRSAVEARLAVGSRAGEQAESAARLIAEAVVRGRMNRDALVRSVLADYWGVAGQVFRELSARAGPRVPPLVQLDDGSERTIYEQIGAGIQESIATGRLQPGERLPTVRELADQLGIAPGTVARAYSELERRGIVVTQGARGTRVAERGAPAVAAGRRPGVLAGMLRPAVVAAFHLGATADELRAALDESMKDIFPPAGPAA